MESVFHYVAPESSCGYLPAQTWQLEYEIVASISPAEYQQRLVQGWRRFGCALFRPRCPACNACRSLRVDVARFRPNRSMCRVRKANSREVRCVIREPRVSPDQLDLYDRYHAFQSEAKHWPEHPAQDSENYAHSFVQNPLPTEEWCYFLGKRLVGVGYVDVVPAGLSAIYFFYDPAFRDRSLGTWNVMCLIERAAAMRLPYLYLGYYVAGCQSMVYKSRFVPNEILGPDGIWRLYGEPGA